jgi:hypothetical protein
VMRTATSDKLQPRRHGDHRRGARMRKTWHKLKKNYFPENELNAPKQCWEIPKR